MKSFWLWLNTAGQVWSTETNSTGVGAAIALNKIIGDLHVTGITIDEDTSALDSRDLMDTRISIGYKLIGEIPVDRRLEW